MEGSGLLRGNISVEENGKSHREYSARFRILGYFDLRRSLKDHLGNSFVLKMTVTVTPCQCSI